MQMTFAHHRSRRAEVIPPVSESVDHRRSENIVESTNGSRWQSEQERQKHTRTERERERERERETKRR